MVTLLTIRSCIIRNKEVKGLDAGQAKVDQLITMGQCSALPIPTEVCLNTECTASELQGWAKTKAWWPAHIGEVLWRLTWWFGQSTQGTVLSQGLCSLWCQSSHHWQSVKFKSHIYHKEDSLKTQPLCLDHQCFIIVHCSWGENRLHLLLCQIVINLVTANMTKHGHMFLEQALYTVSWIPFPGLTA